MLRGVIPSVRERLSSLAGQSERTILLGTVLLVSSVSAATGFFLARYYSVDVITSLLSMGSSDCQLDWPAKIGRHCFGDYALPVTLGLRPDPWEVFPLPPDFKHAVNNYPAGAMVPEVIFGLVGKWLAAPRFGLLAYLLVLTIAVLCPAVWAARGARGLERVVVFVTCGVAAIPAWMVIDRGNTVGFVAPIGLVFLVALCRRRWGLVMIMVILVGLVKPQYAVLAVALFAARRWRLGGIAVAGMAISNVAAFALWPRDFPETIVQSLHGLVGYAKSKDSFGALVLNSNVSFGKGLLAIPDGIKARETGGTIPDDFLAGPRSLLGYAVLFVVVVSVLALGRRLPPVMAGIVLLATASLFPPLSNPYYLVFVLPIAALVVRDPDGPPGTGIFDRFAAVGGRRRAVGICVSLAAALCIAQIALPGPLHVVREIFGPVRPNVVTLAVSSTEFLAPILWLVVCAVTIVSYARRPAPAPSDDGSAPEVPPDDPARTASTSRMITGLSTP